MDTQPQAAKSVYKIQSTKIIRAEILRQTNKMTQPLPASEAIKAVHLRIPKDSLIKLSHHQNEQIVVKFNGGREVVGKLKSWDKSMNLILDNCCEIMAIEEKEQIKRQLGLIIVKGSQIESIALRNGFQIIDSPYADLVEQEDSDQEDGDKEEQEEKGQQQGQKNIERTKKQ